MSVYRTIGLLVCIAERICIAELRSAIKIEGVLDSFGPFILLLDIKRQCPVVKGVI